MKEMSTRYLLLIIASITTLVFIRWFSFDVFSYGDWRFAYAELLHDYLFPSYWDNSIDLGEINIFIWRMPLLFLYGLFSIFSFNINVTEKIVVFLPTIFTLSIASFFFIKEITKSNLGAFTGSLLLSFNTYVLASYSQGHILLPTAFAFMVLAFYLYIKALNTNKVSLFILSGISIFICGFYDFRILYISFFLLSAYFFFSHVSRRNIKRIFTIKPYLPFIISSLLNIFWIVPALFTDTFATNSITSRNLFGSSFFDIIKSFALFHPFWNNSKPEWFIVQPIPLYFFIFPFFAFLGLLLSKSRDKIFWGIVAIVGILLSKQTAPPFTDLYEWLYRTLPGFSAFREASKFYLLITLAYAVLSSFLIRHLQDKSNKTFAIITAIILMSIITWNTKPIITGEIESLFTSKVIPEDYILLKEHLVKDNTFSRVLWLPKSAQWSFYSSSHPKLNFTTFIRAYTSDKLYDATNFFDKKLISSNINSQVFFANLNSASTRYLIVPIVDKVNGDNVFYLNSATKTDDVDTRQWYINQLDSLPYLTRTDMGLTNLAVYENKNYLPAIRTTASLISFDEINDIENKYHFLKNTLNLPFDFFIKTKTASIDFPSISIQGLHETPLAQNVEGNKFIREIHTTGGKKNLYTNESKQNISYSKNVNEITFNTSYNPGLTINTNLLDLYLATSSLISTIIAPANNEIIAQHGSQLFHLKDTDSNVHLGTNYLSTVLYLQATSSLVKNGSFENGLWSTKVGDCNNYDDAGIISMKQSREASDGEYSLELSATRHNACTSSKIDSLDSNSKYLLSFDFFSANAKQGGFQLSFGDTVTIVINERVHATKDGWNKYERLLSVPDETNEANLSLYAYESDGKTSNTVLYDNVRLTKITQISTLESATEPTFKSIELPEQATYNFSFSDTNYNPKNIIPNPSFENGLWSTKVGDCNNYDDAGIISMKQSREASDGEYSLELSATRHNACTGPGPQSIVGGKNYLLSFDYQNNSTQQIGYYVGLNNDVDSISNLLPITDSTRRNEWQTYTETIKIPEEATSASLLVYSYATENRTENVVRYDNFKLIELPDLDNRYYLVSDPETKFVNPEETTFDLVNPTKKLVHIKGATTPFYLAMSESFHPEWEAQFTNKKVQGFFRSWVPWVSPDRIPDEDHFGLNGFLNGWYVDTDVYCTNKKLCTANPDGSYDMELTLEFFPQRWFYLGLLFSGTTLVACVLYLLYNSIRGRRRAHNVVRRDPRVTLVT